MEDKKSVDDKCFYYDSVEDLQYEVIEEIHGGCFQTFRIHSHASLHVSCISGI